MRLMIMAVLTSILAVPLATPPADAKCSFNICAGERAKLLDSQKLSSLFKPYPYDATDGREDPNAAGERVTRGGDHVFDVAPDQLKGYFRDGFSRNPRRGHRHIGFRCAKDAV